MTFVGRADLAVVNARVWTMDPENPDAEAVLIRGGRIAAVGSTAEIERAAGDADRLDAEGHLVTPGFVDGHTHVALTAVAASYWVNAHAPPCESLAEIADAIRAHAPVPDYEWIVCRTSFGLQYKVREARLFTRQELDAIEDRRPVAVLTGLHVCCLNTAGLRRIGLWDGDVPEYITVHRDEDGLPTGVATEVWDRLPGFPREMTMRAIARAQEPLLHANGITTAHTIPFTADDIRAERALQAQGRLAARLRIFYHVPRLTSLAALVDAGLQSGMGDDWLRIGGVKVFVDGEGWDGLGTPVADFKWTLDELTDFLAAADDAGLQVWMHAVTPASVRMAAAAVANATAPEQRGRMRHRIEHGADHLDPGDVPMLRDAGVRLVTTPHFLGSLAFDSGLEPVSAPLRTLIDAGFEVVGGTDSTGTVPNGTGPLFNIACAVNRHAGDGQPRGADERITVEEAFRLFTTWAAAGGFEEHLKGRIAPGLVGDLVLLSDDVRDVAPDRLFAVKVDATIVDGEVVYTR